MRIEPVLQPGKHQYYRLVSVGKGKMFTIDGNMMKCVDIDDKDEQSWFCIEEVEKPKIKAPI